MKVKYERVECDYEIGTLPKGKASLRDEDPTGENIWVAHTPDGKEQILLNHGLAFYPYSSWGTMWPRGSMDVTEFKKSDEPTFKTHSESWDHMLENGIIDKDGNWVVKEEEEK